jgi:hypothetical protein
LLQRKKGIETIATAFTGQLAVSLHLTIDMLLMRRGRGIWKMDTAMLAEQTIIEETKTLWGQFQHQKHYFQNISMCWDRYCKKKLTRYFHRAQARRHNEHRTLMNYCFECIYEVLQRGPPTDSTLPTLNRIKAKLVLLQGLRQQKLLLENKENDRIDGEKPTLYNVLQMTRRLEKRTIYRLRNDAGELQISPSGIAQTMTSYLQEKYDTIDVDASSIQELVTVLHTPHQTSYAEKLAKPFEKEDIYQALRAEGQRKAPGVDGIGRDFYLRTWDVIQADMLDVFDQMFWSGNITPQQKHGVMICLPKVQNCCTPRDYRPITVLNEDYKCLARMIARRLKPVLT